MSTRRRFLIGGTCLAAAGAAYWLKPRRHVSLLEAGGTFAQSVPDRFGSWTSRDVSDPVALGGEDSLTAKLYETVVARVYHDESAGTEILAMFAYGEVQSNLLQLHRPEVCYPAFGYSILASQALDVPLRQGFTLPVRRLSLRSPEAEQVVLYWTRLGEFLPTDGSEQRLDRIKTALAGYYADGLLARFSMITADAAYATKTMSDFVRKMLLAVPPKRLPGLIGTDRAKALASA